MFYGSIPGDVQNIMANTIKDWNCTDLYVGCSGNFTVEKIICPLKKFNLHSNDVILYSYCLGRYLSGQSFELSLTDEGLEKIPWIENYLHTPADSLAVLMLMSSWTIRITLKCIRNMSSNLKLFTHKPLRE